MVFLSENHAINGYNFTSDDGLIAVDFNVGIGMTVATILGKNMYILIKRVKNTKRKKMTPF